MKVYRKEGDTLEIVAFPGESVYKGEYLLVMDEEKSVGLIVQVVDFEYVDVPGLIEEVIREGLIRLSTYDGSVEYDRVSILINDLKILKCKIRSAFKGGRAVNFVDDLPSRAYSKIVRLSADRLFEIIGKDVKYPVPIGSDLLDNPVVIDAYELDGSLTLITGMKGSGKSHLAKLLAYSLVGLGGNVLIFDLNREYLGLESEGFRVLEPGEDIVFSIEYLGKDTVVNVMTKILDLPHVSSNILAELWDSIMRREGRFNSGIVARYLDASVKNLMVKDAILSRLNILENCRFIDPSGSFRLEDLFKGSRGYIVNLRDLSGVERRILVEIFLSKISRLLEARRLPPLFLFAEEAHLYIRETYWEDIVTRMRHFGLFPVFITNQPDSLDQTIFRQLDNIFVFRFLNDKDLETLSKVSNVDADSVKLVVKDLGRGSCLVLGRVVSDFPLVVRVRDVGFEAMGRTRRMFS